MRNVLIAGLAAVVMAMPAGARLAAQGKSKAPSAGICFFKDIDFEGGSFCQPAGTTVPRAPSDVDNQISSLRVYGNVEIVVYDDFDFRGRSMTFRADAGDLRTSGWNDRISSYRINAQSFGGGFGGGSWGGSDSGWGSGGSWGTPSVPSVGACFFEDQHYTGQFFCVQAGNEQGRVMDAAERRVSSIRILGNTELVVYESPSFRGASLSVTQSVPDLRQMNFNDRISSFRSRVRPNDQGWNPGGAYGGGGGGNWGANQPSGNVIGQMEWRGRVDDRVQIAIRGRSVEHQTVSGSALPDGSAVFTSALPNSQVQVSATKRSGRGQVRVVQQPARANNFTAVIEIVDSGGGSGDYRIEVVWR